MGFCSFDPVGHRALLSQRPFGLCFHRLPAQSCDEGATMRQVVQISFHVACFVGVLAFSLGKVHSVEPKDPDRESEDSKVLDKGFEGREFHEIERGLRRIGWEPTSIPDYDLAQPKRNVKITI